MIPIVPAIIPKSAAEILTLLPKLSFSPEIHVDVVDGKFVPYTSWPYSPQGTPTEIRNETDKFTLEVDLMVENPLVAADAWLAAGADMLVFHTENISPVVLKRFSDSTKISIGIAVINDTPLEVLETYLEVVDYVQLMGIAKVGAQGQPFDERVLARILELKKRYPTLTISIDGSVNQNTVAKLVAAGADRLICGSAIVGVTNPQAAFLELQRLTTS
jgi:ribulose-phosphate 3-epimerase